MKKILAAISVVMLLVASAVSCQKEASSERQSGQSVFEVTRYTFAISVNGNPGFDDGETRAVKTGWENGDKIFLFFKPSGKNMLTDTYATMSYNGTSWKTEISGNASLESGGELSAVYVPYIGNVVPKVDGGNWTIASGDVYYSCAVSQEYKVVSGTVKATLDMIIPKDYVQFYFTGISDTDILTCNNVDSFKDITIGDLAVASRTKTTDGKMSGRKFSSSDNGIVFYGRLKSKLPTDCQLMVTKGGLTYERTIKNRKLEHKAYRLGDISTKWIPVLFPGVFSVASDKKVRFSYGNLYWTGNAFEIEKVQFSRPTSWDSKHVGHFYWATSAANAYAEKYNAPDGKAEDVLFTNSAGFTIYGQTGWHTLSKSEWEYLLARKGKVRCGVTVTDNSGGTKGNGLIIAPDSFSGEIQSSYKIADLDKNGLVFLPLTGSRDGSSFSNTELTGFYWTGTGINGNGAYYFIFNTSPGEPEFDSEARSEGRAIRLVRDVEN